MNLTRRILLKKVEHTFSYKDKEYPVKALIRFCADKTVANTNTSTFEPMLSSMSVEDVWGLFNETTQQPIPITLLEFADHVKRVKYADTRYPIIALKEPNRTRVLDGLHRIIKAYTANQRTIPVVWLTPEDMIEFTTGC